MMWEAGRVPNVQYFEDAMNEIKKVFVKAFEALDKIDRKKWTKSAFGPGSNCDELVNNWVEAFNKVIVRARSHPIITMLNIIHGKVTKRLYKQARNVEKRRGDISPHASGLIAFREDKTLEYITLYNRHARYGVSPAHHAWVVDVQAKHCSCGLWQLSGGGPKNARQSIPMRVGKRQKRLLPKGKMVLHEEGRHTSRILGKEKNKKKGGIKRKAGTSMSQPVASNLGDGSSSTQPVQSQPPNTSRKSKKSM
ncbi:hypothetical protein LIER_23568 [Lithospermum erythrorhizon]|uniref:Uncharacterized protein n=1 Tax=Lithospermum erythrorhizon TaxID=34254 RepID=A0AAV3R268_LITER